MASNFLMQDPQPNMGGNGTNGNLINIVDGSMIGGRGVGIPISPMMASVPFSPPTKKRNRTPKQRILPAELERDGADSNKNFREVINDQNKVFCPQEIGFVPTNYWINSSLTFGELVQQFFQRKNNANCRFPQKLFNALLLVQHNPTMWPFVGVKWVSDDTFVVNKYVFGRLLGISACDGGLFHRQGNFPSHGFQEILPNDQPPNVEGISIDYDQTRLLRHGARKFTRTCEDDFVNSCKWENSSIPM